MTLTFWNSYTGTQVTTIEHTIIPRFEKLNPGIKVVNASFPTENVAEVPGSAAAGSPPDVFRTDIAWTAELAGDGVALKLSNQPWYKALVKQALPGPLLTTSTREAAYSLPLDTNTIALFWNKTDFYAAGIANPPNTVGQLFADAQKLTIPSKDQYGLGVDSTDMWDVSPYIWSMGGSFTNKTYTEAGGFMNSGPTIAAVNLVRATTAGTASSGPTSSAPRVTPARRSSRAASTPCTLTVHGPYPTFRALKPIPNYGIVPMPAGPAARTPRPVARTSWSPRAASTWRTPSCSPQYLDSSFRAARDGEHRSDVSFCE